MFLKVTAQAPSRRTPFQSPTCYSPETYSPVKTVVLGTHAMSPSVKDPLEITFPLEIKILYRVSNDSPYKCPYAAFC